MFPLVALLACGDTPARDTPAHDTPAPDPPRDACVVFVGDVALARGVSSELSRSDRSPWEAFPTGDAWVGNLEGTLAEGPCHKDPALCLGFDRATLDRLATSPFAALSLANNHAHDHGAAGLAATTQALDALGIAPLTAPGPHFRTLAGLDLAFVPIDLSTGDTTAALERARLAVGLARANTPWVVVLPHWGVEGVSALGPGQEAVAGLLRAWGATLVMGAGAHVPQASVCHGDAATWYGLGNHLFDQRPAVTHAGALVRCCPGDTGVTCTETRTRRTARSTFPTPDDTPVAACVVSPPSVDTSWRVHPWRDRFAYVQAFPAAGSGAWFTLHAHWSDLDGEVGLRPYVWRVTGERWEDVWRGSSLARPLVAARLFDWAGTQLLCAIHRGDALLAPDPTTRARVRTVYRWTGFGFRAVEDAGAMRICEGL